MTPIKKIRYYDLRSEFKYGFAPVLIGRAEEIRRLERVINRTIRNNCCIVGPSGRGKTILLHRFASHIAANSEYDARKLLQIDSRHLTDISSADHETFIEQAIATIPTGSILFLDDFGQG